MSTHTTPVKLALLAFALAPGLAAGVETTGVLAVAEPPGPGPELVEITTQLYWVLNQSAPGVLQPAELRDRMTGQRPAASLTELERAYSGALATYQAGDYEGAITTLRAVLADLEKLPDGPEAFRQWSRVMLRLARCEQTVGHRAEAAALLERLVRANPEVKVDLGQYPPSLAAQVEEIRGQLHLKRTRRLHVTSTLKGARVFVDGRDVGLAPATVSLAPGRYRVSGAVQELRAPAAFADVTEEDQQVVLDFSLAEALRPGAGPGLALAPQDRARRIVMACASLGLDRAVLTSLVHDGDVTYLQGSVLDVRRGSLQREGRLRLVGTAPPSGGLAALAGFLLTGQRSQLVAPTPATTVPLPPPPVAAAPPARPPDLKAAPPAEPSPVAAAPAAPASGARAGAGSALLRWSPVATLAVAAVAGGIAYSQGAKAQDNYDRAKSLLVGNQLRGGVPASTYNGYVSTGDSARSSAVVFGATAGAALVATGVLGYWSYRQTGEIGPFRF